MTAPSRENSTLCPRCGGHGGWLEPDGAADLEIDCPLCGGHGYADADMLASALRTEWLESRVLREDMDDAAAAVGPAWFCRGRTLAQAIRAKCAMLEDRPTWPPKRGLLRQRDARWHFGTWLCPGLSGGGRASVDIWRAADGSVLVGSFVEANMTPDQADILADALAAAADKARAENMAGAGDE